MLITILLVLLVVAFAGGTFGAPVLGPNVYARWSPLVIILVVLVVLYLTGHLSEGPHRELWR